jgi:PST family polysaccharide transporter
MEGAGTGLRVRAVRGTLISSVWLVGLNLLSLVRGFVVAGLLAASELGTWGVVVAVLSTVLWLREIGLGDRFIQQRQDDQERAFQVFLTLELGLATILSALMLVGIPLYALLLDQPGVVEPGLALAAIPFAVALQAPIWIFYRELDYLRQRLLQSVDPVVGFVVTVSLAASGMGVWSLVIGSVAGSVAQMLVALIASPYRVRLRRPGKELAEYARFSWPLVVASGAGVLIVHATVIAGEAAVGLAGLGAITLANNLTRYTGQIDRIITDTLYPAVCRIVDRPALLYESFVKSSRIALMWGLPFGVGVALFSEDLVDHVIGRQWEPAIVLLQALGLVMAITQIGFNWTAYFRAVGNTRPFATVAAGTCAAFVVACVPLLLADGLRGLAIGSVVMALVQMLLRVRYIHTLFPEFSWWRMAARASAPVLPAAAIVLAARWASGGETAPGEAAALVAGYVILVAGTTIRLERGLLLEVLQYMRGRVSPAAATG